MGRMKNWRYVLPRDEDYQTKIYGHAFENEWFFIRENGHARVKEGYASDGNSPRILVLDWFYLSPPDGREDPETGLPVTYRAFSLHDALLVNYKAIGIRKAQAHPEYCREIKRTNFPLRHVYCAAVTLFGPR